MPGVSLAKFNVPVQLFTLVPSKTWERKQLLPAELWHVCKRWEGMICASPQPPRSEQQRFDNSSGVGTARAPPHSRRVNQETTSHSQVTPPHGPCHLLTWCGSPGTRTEKISLKFGFFPLSFSLMLLIKQLQKTKAISNVQRWRAGKTRIFSPTMSQKN